MKVDVVMWAKNGARYLPHVLERIDEVIPREELHRKILVDDHSKDNTVSIAKDFGWEIHENPATGIPSGANEALRHVDCDYFVSVEQDVLLAKNWWEKVPPLLQDDKTVVASGIRLPSIESLYKLYEYTYDRYIRNPQKYIRSAFLGVSIDNNIYKTKYMRESGGFPWLNVSCGIPNALAKRIFESGLEWKINPEAVSIHLRSSVWEEIKHWYFYGICAPYLSGRRRLGKIALIALFSPIRGAEIAVKKRSFPIFYIYPGMRWAMLLGALRSRSQESGKHY
jgi:glycosyltransferase involved in cell wall biosynthesis